MRRSYGEFSSFAHVHRRSRTFGPHFPGFPSAIVSILRAESYAENVIGLPPATDL